MEQLKTVSTGGKTITLRATFSQFNLPPVRDALVVGKRAPIGPKALFQSLEVLLKGQFELIPVDHPVIEAVIVRKSDLRKLPAERFIPVLLEEAGAIMDESDCLRVEVDISVSVTLEVRET
ncbi:MAG: hypothetical protein DRP95_06535 [Candidatus Latescibacterota bacterium]|nr:MAG: hypothetical protein DRP95_06535 [Candidatus Latescibacterota bacterium]